MKLFLLIFFISTSLYANILDYGPASDSQGNWKFDLYDATGLQRGSSTNPLRFDPVGTTAQPSSQFGTWFTYSISWDAPIATYHASVINLVPGNGTTDFLTITGSSSKLVKVNWVDIACTETTAGYSDLVIIKRSTLNSGGTSQAISPAIADSSDAPPTATTTSYTANPATLGTSLGVWYVTKVYMNTASGGTGTSPTQPIRIYFGGQGKDLALRGVNQLLALNFNSVTHSGNACDVTLEWTEQ